jgi:hypothetical protein
MRRTPVAAVLLCFAALLPALSRAQAPPPPDQPDLAIDATMRRAVVDTLCDRVDRHYVFPEKAREVTRSLRKRMARHEYDRIAGAMEFSDSLTAHVQAVAHDLHLRVHYRHEPIPVMKDDGPPPPEEMKRMHDFSRRRNYGFERIERLPGNVGYLDLRAFSGDGDAFATAVAAMNFLANTDALIIDLRRNGGGHPAMIATILTYLVPADDRLLFNTFYRREGNETEQYHTLPYVPGPRLNGVPLYVLTSRRTGSAAEEFAYDVQTHKLGTLVGEVTAGGANPGQMFRLNEHFAAFIATGRAINPVTKTNWEGVGVRPDSTAKAGEALRAAHRMALRKLIEGAKDDPDRVEALRGALEDAAKRAPEPDEEFVRPQRRRAG